MSSGSRAVPCGGRTDGRTDELTEMAMLINAFRHFANSPSSSSNSSSSRSSSSSRTEMAMLINAFRHFANAPNSSSSSISLSSSNTLELQEKNSVQQCVLDSCGSD